MTIKMTECGSKNIHSHGHDPATDTLAITFRRADGPGNTYHYAGVNAEMYEAFTKAESLGKHFHTTFSGNEKHPGTKQE